MGNKTLLAFAVGLAIATGVGLQYINPSYPSTFQKKPVRIYHHIDADNDGNADDTYVGFSDKSIDTIIDYNDGTFETASGRLEKALKKAEDDYHQRVEEITASYEQRREELKKL